LAKVRALASTLVKYDARSSGSSVAAMSRMRSRASRMSDHGPTELDLDVTAG
jgi:hypothetical protein